MDTRRNLRWLPDRAATLLDAAAARGLDRFVAYVLSGNRRMLGLLDAHTVVLSRTMEQGVTEVRFARRSTS